MSEDDAIDNYFTQQIVGDALVVILGDRPRAVSAGRLAVAIDAVREGAVLVGAAAQGLCTGEASLLIPGQPVAPLRLLRIRRGLAIAALLLWSLMLWFIFRIWYGD